MVLLVLRKEQARAAAGGLWHAEARRCAGGGPGLSPLLLVVVVVEANCGVCVYVEGGPYGACGRRR